MQATSFDCDCLYFNEFILNISQKKSSYYGEERIGVDFLAVKPPMWFVKSERAAENILVEGVVRHFGKWIGRIKLHPM